MSKKWGLQPLIDKIIVRVRITFWLAIKWNSFFQQLNFANAEFNYSKQPAKSCSAITHKKVLHPLSTNSRVNTLPNYCTRPWQRKCVRYCASEFQVPIISTFCLSLIGIFAQKPTFGCCNSSAGAWLLHSFSECSNRFRPNRHLNFEVFVQQLSSPPTRTYAISTFLCGKSLTDPSSGHLSICWSRLSWHSAVDGPQLAPT
jgi:hypothetical protein